MTTLSLEQLDQLLDQLESAATSESLDSDFVPQVLEGLRVTLSARSCHWLLPLNDNAANTNDWEAIASVGEESARLDGQDQASQVSSKLTINQATSFQQDASGVWLAQLVRASNPRSGALVAQLAKLPSEADKPGLFEVTGAFADVLGVRQSRNATRFLDERLDRVKELNRQLVTTDSISEAEIVVANGLQSLVGASRVSVVRGKSSLGSASSEVVAVSHISNIDSKSKTVKNLRAIGSQVLRMKSPVLSKSSSGGPGEGDRDSSAICDDHIGTTLVDGYAVIFEFADTKTLSNSLPLITELLPLLQPTLGQQVELLNIPAWLRRSANRTRQSRPTKWLRSAAVLFVLGILVWLLQRPYPLIIEATGIYEPQQERTVFSTHDGFVEKLFVREGSQVQAGDRLVQLRSPELDLQIEQVSGERASTIEEASGLRVALGQLDPNAKSFSLEQNRLTARLSELQVREQELGKQLELLQQQAETLVIHAAIDGQVVGKDLHLELPQRPVLRGEPLFSVIDTEGDWHLKLRVADRDMGYVQNGYSNDENRVDRDGNSPERMLMFSLDSQPSQKHEASLSLISAQVENTLDAGCYVVVHADVPEDVVLSRKRVGASVHAYFDCGQQPTWFVWSRPLVEACQRRMWLFENSEGN